MSIRIPDLASPANRAEEGTLDDVAMPSLLEVIVDSLLDLGGDRDDEGFTSLLDEPKAGEALVLVEVSHGEPGDLRASRSHLEPHGEDGPVSQPLERLWVRGVEDRPRLLHGEGGGCPGTRVEGRTSQTQSSFSG